MELNGLVEHTHKLVFFVKSHPTWSLVIVFLLAFIESSPVLGTVFPGAIAMTIVGALMGMKALPIFGTLAWTVVAAFAGDSLGYVLGRRYKSKLKRIWPFNKNPHWLTKGEAFFARHGGKSIVIGRFFGPMRSSVPLVAGILDLRPWRFVLAAIPSAVLWAIVYTLPGIVLGVFSVTLPAAEATKFIIFGVVLVAIIWGVFWVLQYFIELFFYGLKRFSYRIWKYILKQPHLRFVVRLIGRTNSTYDCSPLFFSFIVLLCGLGFLILFISTAQQNLLTELNEPVFYLFQTFHTKVATNLAILFTTFGDKIMLTIATAFMSIYLYLKGYKRAFYHLWLIVVLFFLFIGFFKLFFYFPRPQGLVHVSSSSSFPSGHTAFSVAFYGFLTFLSTRKIKQPKRWIAYTKVSIFILLISCSRLYLGAHWLTDILAGLLLGGIILLITIISYRRQPTKRLQPIAWLPVTFVSIALPTIVVFMLDLHPYQRDYNLYFEKNTVSAKQWWNNSTKLTPVYRLNRLAKPIQPLNIQWNAPLSQIVKLLIKQGWETAPISNKIALLVYRFQDTKPEHHIPLLPVLYHGRKPAMLLIKRLPNQESLLVLRLWAGQLALRNNTNPLWIGNVTYQKPAPHTWTIRPVYIQMINNKPALNTLLSDIHSSMHYKIIDASQTPTNKHIQHLRWNYEIALIRNNDLS
jgi:membrane protein DedA with SNARE-associated domain/membrane-associated phospholipid phosphatase